MSLAGIVEMKPTKIYKPNYNKSILNLMATLENALGGSSKYKPLKGLDSKEISKYKNVVLMVFDGLGYEYLMKYGKGSFFNENIKDKLTSVFPAGTSSSIPMFLTGHPAERHGLTGWYTFVKEISTTIIPLLFVSRMTHQALENVTSKDIFDLQPFSNRIKRKSYIVNPHEFSLSDFNNTTKGKSKALWYKKYNINDFFTKTKKAIKINKGKKYIYSYLSYPDCLIHPYGSKHKKVLTIFKKINLEIKKFVRSIEGTDTILIITADHGLYDASKNIDIEKHPKLQECLRMPMCGEGRCGYAYVKPSKVKQFEKYCKTKLKHALIMYKSEDFVKKFKLIKPTERFMERIGDYVLVMKEPYSIRDRLINSELSENIGRHGGFSKEEMFVPLIIKRVK
jgi:hypothetical protein